MKVGDKLNTNKTLYGVQKQQLNHLTKSEYLALRELSYLAKNMYNVALYNIRQCFFNEGKYLNYNKNYHLCKENDNYKLLNANSAQQVIKKVDGSFKSFFGLLKKKRAGSYDSKVKIPKYLDKDGFFTLLFAEFNVNKGIFQVPMSYEFKKSYGKISIKVPSNLKDKTIKEVRILPSSNARFFEVQWVYEIAESKDILTKTNLLAIDLGIDNLITCVTNNGDAFIVDGKRLKSINRWANKENSRLQSIKDKQRTKFITENQAKLWKSRNNKVNDYINKAVRIVVNHCINNDIGTIVLGYNKDIQNKMNIGKANNQNFVNIPIGKIKDKLSYICERYNISLIEQEESYTSKADFLSGDNIPVYKVGDKTKYSFSGSREKRGRYKSATGVIINADINASLNIMRKANVADISLINSAYLSPKRIKIA